MSRDETVTRIHDARERDPLRGIFSLVSLYHHHLPAIALFPHSDVGRSHACRQKQ